MTEASGQEPAVVSLTIPCRAEYVGVARLAILGVASRLNFTYDDVEDLRLAVGEACTSAIDRAGPKAQAEASINIACQVQPDALTVEVHYNLNGDGAPAEAAGADLDEANVDADPENIGALLMEILVDSVDVETDPSGGTTVRLLKRVQLS